MKPHHLLIHCKDKPGIVSSVSQLIFQKGGFIQTADQHGDPETGQFFMRYVIDWPDTTPSERAKVAADFKQSLSDLSFHYQLIDTNTKPRVLILGSKEAHCLADLLCRWRTGDLSAEIIGVASNHATLTEYATREQLPFYHLPIDGNKSTHFKALADLFTQLQPDLIVLARYMQILPSELCEQYAGRMINIHHSFLPSFMGANPYLQALQRGVKLIGATAHYVTTDLDEGPIIEQDVLRVSHRESLADYKRLGRDVERQVLARAVRAHLENRVILWENKTVVF